MARAEYQDSRETFLQLFETEDAREPGRHYILLNNVAYLNILLSDPSLLPEADQFSAEAFKHLPWVPPIMGRRGTVLVELGQLDEGSALLKKAPETKKFGWYPHPVRWSATLSVQRRKSDQQEVS